MCFFPFISGFKILPNVGVELAPSGRLSNSGPVNGVPVISDYRVAFLFLVMPMGAIVAGPSALSLLQL
jgi:hypothetical protein